MTATVDLQNASSSVQVPDAPLFTHWVNAALRNIKPDAELSIRIVDSEESQTFNREYREKDKPTNVLSFPADIPEFVNIPLIGDLIICAPVVEQEAAEQGKPLDAHWAHMVIHGTLHLMGYDHIEDGEAQEMEALEIRILATLHYPSPYE